jgi:Carboxypeptidase regulatory-like domain
MQMRRYTYNVKSLELFQQILQYSFIVSIIILLCVAIGYAQVDQSRISGTVTDSTGAFVTGATVTTKNEKTGDTRTVTSGNDGTFRINALQPSLYTVSASAANFETTTQKNIELLVGQEGKLTLILQPKGVTTSVDIVAGEESLVNVSSASMSANVTQREVDGLPINGRQLSQLYLQAPGAVNSGTGTFSDIRFSGRANQQNVIRYDGVEGSAIIDSSPGNLNGEVPTPFRLQSSLENVQEFKVDSSNFPAEFGTGTGGQISVVTKSGGNKFRGSGFEYIRRDRLDARNFFDNTLAGIAKSKLQLDQFGGSIGGPIVKDKFFFFGSYEQYRGRFGLNFVEAAPSLSLAAPGATFAPLISATNPTGLVNPLIQPYISGFRSPKAITIPGGSATPGFDVVQLQDNEKTDERAVAVRFDYNINPLNKLYLRFFRDQGKDVTPQGVTGRFINIEAVPQNGVFGYQSILSESGSLINEFKLGYNGARTRINGSAPTINGIDYSAIFINLGGSVANTGIAGQGASTGLASPGGLVRANSAQNGRGQPYTPYSLSFIDSLNWIKGNHNVKFGVEHRRIRLYTDRLGGTTYTFSNLASFLTNSITSVQYLGDESAPSPFNNGATGERLAKAEYYIGYAQDEWKLRPGLVLNYGLRYEYYTPLREARNLQVLFNIANGTIRPSTEAALKSSKKNFGPRIGLTWSPNQNGNGFFSGGKTVFRGGFGIFYGPGQTEDQIQPIESDRISTTVTSGALLAFPANIPAIAANFVNNPNTRSYQPRAFANEYTIPEKVYQYSFSWQQQLPGNFVTTAAYIGSQGRNLFLRSVANQILPGAATIVSGANLPAGVGVVNDTDPVTGRVIRVTTIRQFDILTGTTRQTPFAEIDYKTSGGDDKYNALQLSLARSFSTGLTLNTQYTFGRSIGTTAGSNEARTSSEINNFEADRGRNNFDIRHTFNISALYELPFGKGKKFDFGRTGNFLLGGWQVGGIINARSGVPIEVLIVRPDVVIQCTNASAGCTAGEVRALPGTINATTPLPAGFTAVVNTPGGGNSRNIRRPNLVAGVSPFLGNDRNFLNPAAFTAPAPGTFGNLKRNQLSGPIFRQVDVTLAKKFRISETMNFEFRTEVFNILNKTNFANPGATLNNSLSATFQPGTPYTQAAAGATFGLLTSTVGRTVGLGSNRQIQFGFRFNF